MTNWILNLILVQFALVVLVGCPAKTKILYYRLDITGELSSSDEFLKQVGKAVVLPQATPEVGYRFLPEHCDHRQLVTKSSESWIGVCVIEREVYIYSLMPDFGNDPKAYLGRADYQEILSPYQNLVEASKDYLKKKKIEIKYSGYFVADKIEFRDEIMAKNAQ